MVANVIATRKMMPFRSAAPDARQTPLTVCSISLWICSPTLPSRKRVVPSMSTSSGMTFAFPPPSKRREKFDHGGAQRLSNEGGSGHLSPGKFWIPVDRAPQRGDFRQYPVDTVLNPLFHRHRSPHVCLFLGQVAEQFSGTAATHIYGGPSLASVKTIHFKSGDR